MEKKMDFGEVLKSVGIEKFSMAFVLAIVLVGGFLYFNVDGLGNSLMGGSKVDPSVYADISLKVNYTPEGNLKVFALAKNNALAMLKAAEGNPIPEYNSIVIGAEEAEMMKNESLFSAVGNNLPSFFGISTTIGGVLRMTNTPIDYLLFLNAGQFEQISGEKDRMFIKSEPGDMALFMTYSLDDNSLSKLVLVEGTIEDYRLHEIVGKKYYPMIIGSVEAEMMQEEKEFSNIGDSVEEFGKEFIIIGILEDTNSALDRAHIVSLTRKEM
ncbi:MAG: hypothetical protein AABW59_04110 [archaeon]